jgi:hypothetical protein
MSLNRLFLVALLALALFAIPVFAQTASSTTVTTTETTVEEELPDSVVTVLRSRVSLVDWEDYPLEDVVEWLRERGDLNIIPVWAALELEAISPDDVVNLYLRDVTVAEVLNEVVAQISEEGNVTYQGRGNILRIATKSFFNKKRFVRVYDVTDLLMQRPDEQDQAPSIDLQQQQGGSGGGGGGNQSIFTGGGSQQGGQNQGQQEQEEDMGELITLIRETVEPAEWAELGGENSIKGFGRMIVVRATTEVHEEIAGYFAIE